jgi:hypothetical protein
MIDKAVGRADFPVQAVAAVSERSRFLFNLPTMFWSLGGVTAGVAVALTISAITSRPAPVPVDTIPGFAVTAPANSGTNRNLAELCFASLGVREHEAQSVKMAKDLKLASNIVPARVFQHKPLRSMVPVDNILRSHATDDEIGQQTAFSLTPASFNPRASSY